MYYSSGQLPIVQSIESPLMRDREGLILRQNRSATYRFRCSSLCWVEQATLGHVDNESMVTNNDNNIHIGDCGQCPWRDGFLPVLGIQVSRSQQGIRLDVFPHSSSSHSDAKVSSGCFCHAAGGNLKSRSPTTKIPKL